MFLLFDLEIANLGFYFEDTFLTTHNLVHYSIVHSQKILKNNLNAHLWERGFISYGTFMQWSSMHFLKNGMKIYVNLLEMSFKIHC